MGDKVVQNLDKHRDRIKEMWGHLGDLSPDELAAHIRLVRADRRIRKEKVKDRKAKVAKSDTAKSKAEKMLATMSPEQIARLLEGK